MVLLKTMSSNIKYWITTLFLLVSVSASAQNDTMLVDKIVAQIGDNIILYSDVELQYQQMKLEQDIPPEFRCELLNQMLQSKLMLEQATLDSLEVTDDEIEQELNRRIDYFVGMIGSEEQLEAYYGKSILQIKNEFRSDIREQLLAQKMQNEIVGDIEVTPNEVVQFYNSIPKDSLPYFNAEVEVGQIVIYPKVSKTQRSLAISKAEGLKERLDNGEDFCILARIYSDDPGTANDCGDLGFVGRGQLVPEFEAVAFRLKEGETSDIVETKYGYHIIQMIEKKGNRVHVRHILVQPRITDADLDDAKQKLDSIRNLLVNDSMSFETAVGKFSEDETTKHQGGMLSNQQTGQPYFEISQLDKTLYFAIEGLSPGDYSDPVLFSDYADKQAYRIVLLKSQSKPHAANLDDDYYRIKAAALNQKHDNIIQAWIKEKIPETYIFVDDSYRDCGSMKKWFTTEKVTKTKYE